MFFAKENYIGIHHCCVKIGLCNLDLLGVSDGCNQSCVVRCRSLLVFMKEFYSFKCFHVL